MVLLKVGTGVYVSTDEVVLLQSFPSRPARRDKQAAEQCGQYKDATTSGSRREPLRTLVHLRCGLLVGSPITADALAKRSPVSAPIKMSTRRNNLDNAQILDGELPVENAPPAPHRHRKNTPVGEPIAPERDEEPAPSQNPNDDEKPRRPRGLGGLKRLMGRE